MPKVRHSLVIVIPSRATPENPGSISVIEQKDTVRIAISESGSALERNAVLSLPEARKLSEHINTICRRISHRPTGQP
jgi:hypothetical protein